MVNVIDSSCLGDCFRFACLYNHSINNFIDSLRNIIGVYPLTVSVAFQIHVTKTLLQSSSFGIGLGALGARDPDTDVLKRTFGWTGVVVNKGVHSDVPARLGLKAAGKARHFSASAFEI